MINGEKEVKRKIFHMLTGFLIIFLIDIEVINVYFLIALLVVALVLSFISKRVRLPIVKDLISEMDRPRDVKIFPGRGAIEFLIGIIIVLVLFDKNLALASIMVLTVGDSVSYLMGANYGEIRHPLNRNKLFEGTVFGFLVSFLGASIFINYKLALVAAFFGMLIEAIELRFDKETVINDNVIIPVISGLAVYLFKIFI